MRLSRDVLHSKASCKRFAPTDIPPEALRAEGYPTRGDDVATDLCESQVQLLYTGPETTAS